MLLWGYFWDYFCFISRWQERSLLRDTFKKIHIVHGNLTEIVMYEAAEKKNKNKKIFPVQVEGGSLLIAYIYM